jgi:hypothetical protein
MSNLEPDSAAKLVEGLSVVFYVGMLAALLTAVMGSPGWATLLLLLGSCALVVRTGFESSLARRPASD